MTKYNRTKTLKLLNAIKLIKDDLKLSLMYGGANVETPFDDDFINNDMITTQCNTQTVDSSMRELVEINRLHHVMSIRVVDMCVQLHTNEVLQVDIPINTHTYDSDSDSDSEPQTERIHVNRHYLFNFYPNNETFLEFIDMLIGNSTIFTKVSEFILTSSDDMYIDRDTLTHLTHPFPNLIKYDGSLDGLPEQFILNVKNISVNDPLTSIINYLTDKHLNYKHFKINYYVLDLDITENLEQLRQAFISILGGSSKVKTIEVYIFNKKFYTIISELANELELEYDGRNTFTVMPLVKPVKFM